jgi:60 kDa SS-A/Ro ribonucleoprotein
MDALSAISTVRTPQSEPILGREADMVRNSAGGFTFAKDVWTKLEDFVILGTTGGTYYVGEKEHTYAGAKVVFDAITADGVRAVALATQISAAQPARAPKNFPALFVLAAAVATGDLDTRRAARAALPRVARTTDHLAHFWGYYKNLRGKPSGRGTKPVMNRLMRTALTDWFLSDEADRVAFRACKAKARKTGSGEPFALKDMLRLAKPHVEDPAYRALFGWLAGTVTEAEAGALLPSVEKYRIAKSVTRPAEAVTAVRTLRVPWEFLDDGVLDSPEVWAELAHTVGLTALIRNLARMTRIGALTPLGSSVSDVAKRLTDSGALAKARVHPLDLYLALKVYNSGSAQPNPKAKLRTWSPITAVSDALEEAFELSFGHVEPSGRKLVIAVDSSGSMSSHMTLGGSPLGSVYEVANGMALTTARIEKGNVQVIDVDTSVHASRLTARTSLREIQSWRPSGGGTDLSLPFSWAQRAGVVADGFLVLTDNETWAGKMHPSQALRSYRSARNPNARLIVASMTAAGHTIADPRDEGVLQVAGFDASLPQLVSGFLRG